MKKKKKSLSEEAMKAKKLLNKKNRKATLGIIALYIIIVVTGFTVFKTGNEDFKYVFGAVIVPTCGALLVEELKDMWGKK